MKKLNRRNFVTSLAGTAAACGLPSLAFAAGEGLPKGPVRMVVGFPPGGGTDVLARILANRLNAMWGIPVIVDNKVGAAGNIAAAEVARAAPDGHTLMMGHINSLGIAPGLFARLPFNAATDFSAIALVGQTPQVLVGHVARAAPTLQGLVEQCRANPGKVNFGSAGSGSAQHLALALFEQTAGVQALHVPYKGSAPLMNDLVGGHVDYAFEGMTTASPFVKGGKVRAVAQTGARRSRAFPELPTVAESGYPGFSASIWFGLVGPARMPAAVINRINADVNKALANPEVVAQLETFGAEDGGGTPERFSAFMHAEQAKWAQLIKARRISAET